MNLSSEHELDLLIKNEIKKAIAATHALQEKDLTDLDIKVATAARNYRVTREQPASEKLDDGKSQVSYQSRMSNASRAKSTASLRENNDAIKELRGMNQGKPLGMTEVEWNEIVQKNFNQYRHEEKDKKEKLTAQREQMKAELLRQVASKSEKEQDAKHADKQRHMQQLAVIEKKLIDDEMDKQLHS